VTGFAWQLDAPLGELAKKTAAEIYGHSFVNGYDTANSTDFKLGSFAAIIHPQIQNFAWQFNQARNAGFAITPQVKMTLNLELLSPETNTVIFQRQYDSGWVDGNTYVVNLTPMEAIHAATQKTIATLMADSLRDLDTVIQNAPPKSFPSISSGQKFSASGTGFFITQDGYLLTNAHVVKNADKIEVKTKSQTCTAEIIKTDIVNDIAILKVNGSFDSLPLATSQSSNLGDSVFTIGFPDPELQGIEPKLTDGKISSIAGLRDDPRYFQISLPVQPGNSGGPLVDSMGNVVGIVSARLSDKAAIIATGALPQNVNYAVKIGYAKILLDELSDVSRKIKQPQTDTNKKFEDAVKETQNATALITVSGIE
jgi:S1-C subfamily serine protease